MFSNRVLMFSHITALDLDYLLKLVVIAIFHRMSTWHCDLNEVGNEQQYIQGFILVSERILSIRLTK
jgi:hypothetical protein